MNRWLCGGLVFGVMIAAGTVFAIAGQPSAGRATPRVKVSRATTFFSGPVTTEGFIDYAKAINRRQSEGLTVENNANVLFWRAIGPKPVFGPSGGVATGFFKLLGIAPPAKEGKYLFGFSEHLERLVSGKTDNDEKQRVRKNGKDQQSLAERRPWRSSQHPVVASWLKKNQPPLDLVVQGTKRGAYFSPLFIPRTGDEPFARTLVTAEMPGLQGMRKCARGLVIRAMWHLGEGRIRSAWNDLLACHRLGRFVSQGPMVIDLLVGYVIEDMAIRGELILLQDERIGEKELVAYRRELMVLPAVAESLVVVDLAERCMFLDMVQRMPGGGTKGVVSLLGESGKRVVAAQKGAAGAIDWTGVMKMGNGWYDRVVAAQRIPIHRDRRKELQGIASDLLKLADKNTSLSKTKRLPKTKKAVTEFITNVLLTMMFPASLKLQDAEDRSRQRYRNLRVALALERFQRAEGSYPASVSQLSPSFLKQIPGDIFTGKALVYRKTKAGYVLYSLGPNGVADSGRDRDGKSGGDDISVQVPAGSGS